MLNEPLCRFAVVIDDELQDDVVHKMEESNQKILAGHVIAAMKYHVIPGDGPHPDTDTQDVIDNPQQPLKESLYEKVALSNVFVEVMVAARQNVDENSWHSLVN